MILIVKIRSGSRNALFVMAFSLLAVTDCYSQKSGSQSFFLLLNSGKSIKHVKQFETEGTGSLVYRDSLLYGRVHISEKTVALINESKTAFYSYDDATLKIIYLKNVMGPLKVVRLKDVDNRLWRLIKDTLGMKVYDKNISFQADGNNIDYASLIFRSNSSTYEAVTFWVTSTKRSIVKIINHLLHIELNPKEFKGKEDLMNQIINNDSNIYSNFKKE